MNPLNFYEAYSAVYNEELREELLTVEEDFEFVDDLSDNELDQIMEEILSEGTTLTECVDAFDQILISEATVTSSDDRPSGGSARVTVSHATEKRSEKTAERRRKVRVGRIAQAAGRAAEAIKSGAKKAAKKVGGKLAAAKEKISSTIKRVGRAGKAAYKAAKHELSGQREKETKAKRTGYEMRKAAKKQAAKADAKKSFESPKKAPEGTSENPRIGYPGKERKALPPGRSAVGKAVKTSASRRIAAAAKAAKSAAGSTSSGVRIAGGEGAGRGVSSLTTTKKAAATAAKAIAAAGKKRRAKKATAAENYDMVADMIMEGLILEGYAEDIFEAYEILIEMEDSDVGEIVESYFLTEEVEDRDDLFDYILEYLVAEGYADTNESALVIMANMSEEWRDEIIDEGYQKLPVGRMMGQAQRHAFARGQRSATSQGSPKDQDSHRKTAKMSVTADLHNPEISKAKEYENRKRGIKKKVYGG